MPRRRRIEWGKFSDGDEAPVVPPVAPPRAAVPPELAAHVARQRNAFTAQKAIDRLGRAGLARPVVLANPDWPGSVSKLLVAGASGRVSHDDRPGQAGRARANN